ncbi:GntR family transcriptional regulator [Algoriphagus machipongonensis]|uniref:FucR protein n=1 Tax=Algoriphagus machipongonensis TaxID=388413 RepID=A3HYV3_9BACT|nr:GntR family transcriptional regulator [Algoriphagus machipongonensis]EAZ80439.1 FucR protein [Algoriphagus machipongonensis]
MLVDKSERIHTDSRTPKYLQVVNLILDEIEKGKLKIGDRIPSINETSFDFLLSRDTVEKAYNELKDRGIISSVRGKGFYVTSTNVENKVKVLLLFNKLSSYKKIIYYTIIETLGEHATVDMHVHHYNVDLLEDLIHQNVGKYNYYVIAPHFFDKETHPISGYELLKKIPKDKLLIMDRAIKGHENEFPGVFQDFAKDIFAALETGLSHLRKYKKMILVFPKGDMYPLEIVDGFKRFCFFHDFENMILDGIDDAPISDGDLFLVLAESDLVNIIKKAREQMLTLGQDVGLISYNETPLKEILDKGISTISTDFIHMGKSIGRQIMGEEDKIPIKNPFRLIVRKSL